MPQKKHLILVILTILSIFSGFSVINDSGFIQLLKARLKVYNQTYPQEKLYLQFDKPFYKPGEDLWFNAFVLNSNTHLPTSISDVLYVELIDPKGNVTSKLELLIDKGTTHGDFALEDNAPGGLYKIRAYTQWMKNFGEKAFFKKEIQVQRIITPRLLLKLDFEKEAYGPGDTVIAELSVNDLKNEKVSNADIASSVRINGKKISESKLTSVDGIANLSFSLPQNLNTKDGLLEVIVSHQGVEESISRSIPIILDKITLQFFPEGGHHIQNVNSKIAFKALNEFGKGADVAGSIVDENNDVVTHFESFHMGMGAFEINASAGKKYFAKIEAPKGNETLAPLPTALDSGFGLRLEKIDPSSMNWTIYSPEACEAHLVGQTHGEITYAEKVKLNKGNNTISVSTSRFPAGITVFTLFDEFEQEQCERLVFLNKEKGLNIRIEKDKDHYLPGEPVNLKIKTTNNQGKPIQAKMSLSVVDDQLISFADDKQDNILSSLLLSSEVRGEIQEPSFYFDEEEKKATQALDYLLMTQGWRRFTWEEVKTPKLAITSTPEKARNISGRTLSQAGQGISTNVFLIELWGQQRMEKVRTTEEGYFIFKNIDPTVPIMLLAKKPATLELKKNYGKTFSISLNDDSGTVLVPEIAERLERQQISEGDIAESEIIVDGDFDLNMSADIQQLSEVVVVGYGAQRKKSIVGSIEEVDDKSLDGLFTAASIESSLQGRVAGVSIQNQSGTPGSLTNIRIRGASSLRNGKGDPLLVVDGIPLADNINKNFSTSSIISPDDIASIEVLASPAATAFYGSRASNGVILITTKNSAANRYFPEKKRNAKYNSQIIQPRAFSATREFYVPRVTTADANRKNFNTTVYWNHTITTDKKGEAELSFVNNDAVSAFRITAEGITANGLIGREEEVYFTQLPFSLDTKLPEYLGFEDTLKLAIRVKNETKAALSGAVSLKIPAGLEVLESTDTTVTASGESTETLWFTLISKGLEGEFPLKIELSSNDYKDEINHTLRVHPVGFPVRLSFSGKELDKTVRFKVQDAERGSLKAEFTAYPNVLEDLFGGAESILRQPYGCFEQVSSSTFPNILALQYLKQSGLIQPKTEKLAMEYIKDGYKRLIGYEVKGGGFEWFGHTPAHEGLTAFGLVEFHEMKKVYPEVNDGMVKRTRNWLLSRRDGKGGFKKAKKGFDSFHGQPDVVANAYIVYALSEIGTKNIMPEYSRSLQEALKSKDMYRMALMANAAANLNQMGDYKRLMNYFKDKVNISGFANIEADHSVVSSYGKSLRCETISFWTVALMKSPTTDLPLVDKCIKEIVGMRSYGGFGSTQATTMALKALTEYAYLIKSTKEDGEIKIFIDNQLTVNLPDSSNLSENLASNNFANSFSTDGEQKLRIFFDKTSEPMPYSMNVQWYTKQPIASDQCQVSLQTSLASSKIKVNETVRLSTTLRNKTSKDLPMTVAVVGIPAGLSLQPWQLKELQEEEQFDFYEVIGNNLVLYYTELAPNASHTIHLDLKAEMSGVFTGAASSAYLYYTEEYKDWVKGERIVVE